MKKNHTGSTLNVRMQGNVISNKTEPYDPKTVKLPREILQVLNTKLSIQDMLGIKQSQVIAGITHTVRE